VPRLAGKTLSKARNALAAANCTLGKVRKPKGAKLRKLRVKSSSPPAGSLLAAGSSVDLRLARVKSRR
jgi:beta-lactam-binding protein with PASTA domain